MKLSLRCEVPIIIVSRILLLLFFSSENQTVALTVSWRTRGLPSPPVLPISSTIPVAKVHEEYVDLAEGKHNDQRVSICVVVEEVKQTSSRLAFLRVRDSSCFFDDCDDSDSSSLTNSSSDNSNCNTIELLLRERDGFLTNTEISTIVQKSQDSGAILHCRGFPEKLSLFDGPSFFPTTATSTTNSSSVATLSGVCLHVVAANITTPSGEFLQLCPEERPPKRQELPFYPSRVSGNLVAGRMPPLIATTSAGSTQQQQHQQPSSKNGRGGLRNRDRGGIFAAWALETFGAHRMQQGTILDVAGGSGQLAFQLGVRRGMNITVVDPRFLRLASDQRRTLQYHRQTGLRLLPEGRDPSLPSTNYGHHFCEVGPPPHLSRLVGGSDTDLSGSPNHPEDHHQQQHHQELQHVGDKTWLVGGQAYVRHLAAWFNPAFVEPPPTSVLHKDDATKTSMTWRDASVVLGMHTDEATEDLVDLALSYNKPFAVVPCCVFWKQHPRRRTPSGKAVRTWEQYCEYLLAKGDSGTEQPNRIQAATLPFPGRNVVLYSFGDRDSFSTTNIEELRNHNV